MNDHLDDLDLFLSGEWTHRYLHDAIGAQLLPAAFFVPAGQPDVS